MTYDQLVTLEAIVKEGSFKAAANRLAKTQPSLSAAIKKLEEEFQVQLFSREKYRPELTEKGRAFYNKALPALETFRELETYAKELAITHEIEISISVDAIFPLQSISPLLQNFFKPHIAVSLNLTIDILEGVTEKVLEHQTDFAVGTYFEPRKEIDAVKLFDIVMVPVVAPSFYQDGEGNLRKLKKIPQIIVRSSSKKSSDNIVGALSGAKAWLTSDMMMKEQLIEQGLGWGRLPMHQVEKKIKSGLLAEVRGIKEITRLEVPVYLLKSRTKTLGPNATNLWKYLLEAFQK